MIQMPHFEWWAIAPELVTAIGAMIVLLVGLGRTDALRNATTVLSVATLAIAGFVTIMTFDATRLNAFNGQIDSDQLANVGRLIAQASGIVAILLAVRGRARDGRHGEFHALVLASICGMGVFAAAGSFVSLFVGLELFSIALYVLCALDADRATSLESGLKYLIIGGLSSSVILYGAALLYGATGTLDLGAIGAFDGMRGALLWLGGAMVLAGMSYKISAAPVHWWTVDVYDGAGTPVTAFMSVATKAVAFVALARVLTTALGPEHGAWMPIVAMLATASIAVGNIGAIVQQRLKRMLGYSSIAQAGYLLLGIVGWQYAGIAALVYALVVYAAMTLGSFAYVIVVERAIGRDSTYADLAGRGWINGDDPLWRVLPPAALTICALSLAGIPPTSGFFSKFGLFTAAVDAGYAWLAVVAAIGSVFGLAYYLRIIVELYAGSQDEQRLAAAAADVPAHGNGPQWPVGTRAPLAAGLGVLAAVVVLALAITPRSFLDAGCDASGQLLTSPRTAGCAVAAADHR